MPARAQLDAYCRRKRRHAGANLEQGQWRTELKVERMGTPRLKRTRQFEAKHAQQLVRAVLEDKRIPPTQRAVLAMAFTWIGPDATFWPGHDTLHEKTGAACDTVNLALTAGRELEYCKPTGKRGSRGALEYRVALQWLERWNLSALQSCPSALQNSGSSAPVAGYNQSFNHRTNKPAPHPPSTLGERVCRRCGKPVSSAERVSASKGAMEYECRDCTRRAYAEAEAPA